MRFPGFLCISFFLFLRLSHVALRSGHKASDLRPANKSIGASPVSAGVRLCDVPVFLRGTLRNLQTSVFKGITLSHDLPMLYATGLTIVQGVGKHTEIHPSPLGLGLSRESHLPTPHETYNGAYCSRKCTTGAAHASIVTFVAISYRRCRQVK